MKVRVPERVKVGPLVFEVVADEAQHKELCDSRNEYVYGAIRVSKQVIFLDPNLPLGQLQDTLLHEVLHAIWWVAGFRGEKERVTEEEVIERTTSILLDTLQRNPQLTAFLMQQEEE